ncbi:MULTISPECIES: AAA family ATPase [unclassified Clostridium]|uniref:AAA family ATPase n=1 Tax=unclassified Clostridium TaxID=2614128 RepID=UPI0025C2909A|nr:MULTISPECIES: AAA family ATPase [unclassified Clostridium]
MNSENIKCLIKLNRQFYPKDSSIKNGDFGIVSVSVEEVLEGEVASSKWGTITVTGNLCEMNREDTYTLVAKEVEDEKYGKQYKSIYISKVVDLNDINSQKIFLKKILTERQVDNLFKTFESPISIIESEDVEQLCNVKGIGVSSAIKIIEKYKEAKDYSTAYIELDRLGLSTTMIRKLVDVYGGADILVDKIKDNPYILADEVDGIGWSKADEMALQSGCGEFSVYRTKAYIQYFLTQQANNGNTYVYPDALLIGIEDIIGMDLPQEIITEAIAQLRDESKIYFNDEKTEVSLMKYYKLENAIADEIIRINSANNDFVYDDWEEYVHETEERQGWKYTEEQFNGIKSILENNISIISGGAGTGKTSTVAGMLSALRNYSVAQTALSGKASVNLTEATGEEGYTIHRLLGFIPSQGFSYNKFNMLPYDIIILDELSMVGAELFYKLIQAIKTGSKLIMLGDTGQLESIGVGNIMQDLMDSGYINCVELTTVHRQAQKSAVISESLKIRNGLQITESNQDSKDIRGELQDLVLDVYKEKTKTQPKLLEYVKELLPQVDDIMELQVIVPVKERGDACTYKLNNAIQQIIRERQCKGMCKQTSKQIILHEGSKYPYVVYVGDKVINVKNNYKTINMDGQIAPIFNGDMGIVTDIDSESNMITVKFQTVGEVVIPKMYIGYIQLGYAITTHKSQGSGFKYVICGLDYSHYNKLLTREMVYTMITRAKKYCVLCAENKALRYAIGNTNVSLKQTYLSTLIKNKMKRSA